MMKDETKELDHPIFRESIHFIKSKLRVHNLDDLQEQVLLRLIHTSGDFKIGNLLNFSEDACLKAVSALQKGAPILTDTSMASAAISSMAAKIKKTQIFQILDWVCNEDEIKGTKTELGMERAWIDLTDKFPKELSPLVVIGSSPTALNKLLDLISTGSQVPSLIVGMPVGFIGVAKSKKRLESMELEIPQIRLDGSRGGAGCAASVVNALIRAAIISSEEE
tara:strand:- start:7732 stop:8397 length:666 start_codon:yes stop_codon:yes gene_type:complete